MLKIKQLTQLMETDPHQGTLFCKLTVLIKTRDPHAQQKKTASTQNQRELNLLNSNSEFMLKKKSLLI